MPSPEGPVVVVTGARGRIGRQLLTTFDRAGFRTVGLDLPRRDAGPDDGILDCDITDAAQVAATFTRIGEEHRQIGVLVNNAGITAIGAFLDHDVATHRALLEVNHLGAVACTQAALPLMRRGSRIVVMSSVAGFAPVVGRPAYVASKHALTGLFEALRPELAPRGVGVTLVHPTFVTGGGMGEGADRKQGTSRTTAGAQVTPDDVAAAVLAAVHKGRDRVLIGSTSMLSWHIRRLAPATYVRLMLRRLKHES